MLFRSSLIGRFSFAPDVAQPLDCKLILFCIRHERVGVAMGLDSEFGDSASGLLIQLAFSKKIPGGAAGDSGIGRANVEVGVYIAKQGFLPCVGKNAQGMRKAEIMAAADYDGKMPRRDDGPHCLSGSLVGLFNCVFGKKVAEIVNGVLW